jgi:hypothetical protein
MSLSVRMPYGSAKQIVASMQLGESKIVQPQWVVSLHNAARRMGLRISALSFHEKGQLMYRIVRIPEGSLSFRKHAVRRPRRDEITGRWLRGSTL